MPIDLATHDCTTQALSRLPAYMQRQRWQEFVTAVAEEIQELDDALVAIVAQLHIDAAADAMLDLIGDEVGEGRSGRLDDDYRQAIKVRVQVSRSRGLAEDVIAVARTVLDDTAKTVELQTIGIASASLVIGGTGTTGTIADSLTGYARKAVAAGVRLLVETSTVADADTFRFADVGASTTLSLTIPAHGLVGDPGNSQWDGPFQLTTTGVLPAGLFTATDYWVVVVDADHVQLATSFSNAAAGIVVDIGSAGSGTHTISKTAQTSRSSPLVVADASMALSDAGLDTLFFSPFAGIAGPFQFTTTGTLPGGLALATNYWAYDVDGLDYKVGLSLSDVYTDGIFVDITDAGVGVHTIHDTSETAAFNDEVAFSPSTFTVDAPTDGKGFGGSLAYLSLGGILGSGYDTVVGLRSEGAVAAGGDGHGTGANTVVTLTFDGDAGAPGTGTLDVSTPAAIVFTFKPGVTTIADFEALIAGDASEYLYLVSASNSAGVLASPADEFSATPFDDATGTAGGAFAHVQE